MVASGNAVLVTVASTDETASDSISECFQTYLVVLISSSRGLRNATCLSVGKMGLLWHIENLGRSTRGIGLFTRIDEVLCGSV